MTTPVLQVDQVGHAFGGLRAVHDVSLALKAGEALALIGPNGAGKTTLLNLLGGERRPDTGRVVFLGEDVTRAAASAATRAGLLRSYQNGGIFPKLTAVENVAVPLLARGVPSGRARTRAREVLADLGLAPVLDERAEALSGGQRKLVDFARCLATPARLVLLDEPTNGVNPHLSRSMSQRIDGLRGEGAAFLIVSHDLPWAFALCTRAVVMAAGQILTQGDPAAVAADPRVHEAYL